MKYTVQAACGCHRGRVRANNEDNFFFDGKCLEQENDGLKHPVWVEETLKNGFCAAVFDGMGGENYGEAAAFAAAREMQRMTRSLSDYFVSERTYLLKLSAQLNDSILNVQKELYTDRCGTTMVALYYSSGYVYVCNVGDSRAYRLRNGEFLQLSEDHVEKRPAAQNKKPLLTQHLGIDPKDIQIQPYIAKGKIAKGDTYLLCSDGLTDMLTNAEICGILQTYQEPAECADKLIQAALEHGGRDNITVIICKID